MRYVKENKITINRYTIYRRNERNSHLSFFIICTKTTKVHALLTYKETKRNSLSPKTHWAKRGILCRPNQVSIET